MRSSTRSRITNFGVDLDRAGVAVCAFLERAAEQPPVQEHECHIAGLVEHPARPRVGRDKGKMARNRVRADRAPVERALQPHVLAVVDAEGGNAQRRRRHVGAAHVKARGSDRVPAALWAGEHDARIGKRVHGLQGALLGPGRLSSSMRGMSPEASDVRSIATACPVDDGGRQSGDKNAKIRIVGLADVGEKCSTSVLRVSTESGRDARTGIPLPRTKGMLGTTEGDEDTFVVLFCFVLSAVTAAAAPARRHRFEPPDATATAAGPAVATR